MKTRKQQILKEMLQECNWHVNDFDDLIAYDMWYFDDLMEGRKPFEIASMASHGDFNGLHELFRFDGYGNFITFNESDYLEEIEDYESDIVAVFTDIVGESDLIDELKNDEVHKEVN